MPSRASEQAHKQLMEETRDLLVQRVGLSLIVLIPVLAAFAVADYLKHPQHLGALYGLKLAQVVSILTTVALLHTPVGRRWAVPLAVAEACFIYANVGIGAVVIKDVEVTPISLIGLSLIPATAYPWGPLPQSILAVFGCVVVAANAMLVTGDPASMMGYPQMASYTALVMSAFLARVFDHHRMLEMQGELSSALATVGRTMIAALDTPSLANRLCEVTAEVLRCDCSHTFLWNEREHGYLPVASYGDSAEQWEAMKVLSVSRTQLAPLLDRFAEQDVTQLDASDELLASFRTRYRVGSMLCMPLRSGTEVIGLHTASFRSDARKFSPQQERIACNIGQLASMATEHSNLVRELENANTLKSDFLLTVSHEFRTPLNIILGYNALLLEGGAGPLNADQEALTKLVTENARSLLGLFTSTLEVTRLDRSHSPIQYVPIALPELMRELELEAKQWSGRERVDFEWSVSPGLPTLYSDRVKLKVALKNLLTNAFKFTPSGSVELRVGNGDGGTIEFAVADTGIGIAPEAQTAIFEAFRKADHSIIVNYEGLGLGLYIVNRLTEMLGGSIGVESAPGKGSTFRLWLPPGADRRSATHTSVGIPTTGATTH